MTWGPVAPVLHFHSVALCSQLCQHATVGRPLCESTRLRPSEWKALPSPRHVHWGHCLVGRKTRTDTFVVTLVLVGRIQPGVLKQLFLVPEKVNIVNNDVGRVVNFRSSWPNFYIIKELAQ